MYKLLVLLTSATLTLSACAGYSKEAIGLSRTTVSTKIPNQQRLLALAVDNAVKKLDFKKLAGKRVTTEISGIFPHTKEELLNYIQTSVEGKLARQRVIIVKPKNIVACCGETNEKSTITLDPEVDYRITIGVSWAGIDTHSKKSTNGNLLMKQILLGIASTAAGFYLAEERMEEVALPASLGLPGAIAWYIFDRPVVYTKRLIGRVRLSVNAIPSSSKAGKAFIRITKGQTEILIDPQAEKGYRIMSTGWFN